MKSIIINHTIADEINRLIKQRGGKLSLRDLVAEARQLGAERLTIRADPNAAGFYERNGAARIGEAPSDAVPGRLLRIFGFTSR